MSKEQFSLTLKKKLNMVIDETAQMSGLFVRDPERDFTRDRKLPFGEMLRLLCGMRGNCLNKELFDWFKDRDMHVTASAFVQQRTKLLPEGCEYIFHTFNDVCSDTATYKGMHLYAVDGTDVVLATDKTTRTYIPQGTMKGCNLLHVNALYDLCNRTYKDALIQLKQESNEPVAATEMVRRSHLGTNDLIIADRGYPGYNFFETLNRLGVKYLVRVQNTFTNEIKDQPMASWDKDLQVELRTTKTKEDLEAFALGKARFIKGVAKRTDAKQEPHWFYESPFLFKYRCVRFEITPDSYETIITNLNRFEFPASEIKVLYSKRWGIETSFRELKYAIGLIQFHARKEDYVRQEIFCRLTMYNFCERITMKAVLQRKPSEKTIHTYQVNYTMAIHICVDFFRCHDMNGPPNNVEEDINQYVLPVRPGRQDKRKMRTKAFTFFLYRVA